MTEVFWKNAPDFAEVAEALGITTQQILASMNPQSNEVLVLWTETLDDNEGDLWSAGFRRDTDGILRQCSPTRQHVGMLDEIHASVDRRMREQFGEPRKESSGDA